MGVFSGLGRGLGAAAQGYGLGQRQGEQEAYNRSKAEALLNLRLRATQKPVKEDVPYPIKTLLDTDRAVMSSGNPEHINNWIGSGNHDAATVVGRAYAQGGKAAALQAYGVANQPVGTDTSSALGQLATGGGAPADLATMAARAQTPQVAGGNDYGYVKPSINPKYEYRLGTVDTARAANLDQSTARSKALTPADLALIQARTKDIGFKEGLDQRRFNLDAAQADFNNDLRAAQQRASFGFKDRDEQNQTWAALLDSAARVYAHGGDPGAALKPFLFTKGMMGQQTINPDNAKRYLLSQGISEQDADAIVGAASPGGLKVQGGQGAPTPTATSQMGALGGGGGTGAPPVLPNVGAGPTTNMGLAGAESFAGNQGFKVTSTTGGQHNPGSLHYQGRALDVGVRDKSPADQKRFIVEAQRAGYTVRDERTRPKGQAVWGGPHIHIEWGGQGPPAALPGMTSDQVLQAMNPGGDPNATANAMGVNTPATAPPLQNPWKNHPESLESRIWEQVTKGRPASDIMNEWKGQPEEGLVQHIIESANTQQREGLFHGIPVADRFGARAPDPTNFSGQLGYRTDQFGPATVTTSPVEPTGGFGPGTPTPRTELPPTDTSNVTITEKVPPSGSREFSRVNTPLKARGGLPPVKEKGGPGRDVTISPPPPVRSPQSMGPPTKGPVRDLHAQLRELNPAAAGFKAGQDTRAAFDEGGIKQLLTPQPGSGMARLVQAFKESLGPTGFDEVKIRKAPAGSIYDNPAIKQNEGLKGWNTVFKPWAQRMGYTTADQVLGASKWYFAQEDRLRRPPYSLTEAEAEKQLKVALESFANAPGQSLRLRVPKTGGPGNPRVAANQGPGPGTVEYRGKGR